VQAGAERGREEDEALRVKAIASAEAKLVARRAASRAERLPEKAAEAVEEAARVRAAAGTGTEASAAPNAAGH